ncbi:MAG: hypothetical protein JXB15_11115 [Anaerolineales bacterium]|nr:hypothetical protein [Anaerolineales bacterium]
MPADDFNPIIFIVPVAIGLVAVLVGIWFLYLSGQKLNTQQKNNANLSLFLGAALMLFFGALWIGDSLRPTYAVRPAEDANYPFWEWAYFDFEQDAEGWEVDPNCAAATMENQSDALQAFHGEGYLQISTELKSREEGQPIALEQMACLKYTADASKLALMDGLIGYIKIPSSLDTIGNSFQAEFQVRGTSGEDSHWAKARYPIKVGEWVPLVWVKPSWLTVGSNELFFPQQADGVWITIWADRSYKGPILVDSMGFYLLQRR